MRRLAVLLLSALLATAGAAAQSAFHASEVQISADRVMVGDKLFFSHVVRERQTLYSIGKTYGVSALEIIEANPSLGLDKRAIKPGDILLIPATEKALENAPQDSKPAVVPKPAEAPALPPVDTCVFVRDSIALQTDSLVVVADSLMEEEFVPEFILDIPQTVKVALMLPIGSRENANPRYLNYYFGSLLAAKTLGERGIKMDITTVDTAEPGAIAAAKGTVSESDVIIGPVSVSDISAVLPYLPSGRFVVSPMDAKTEDLTIDSPVVLAATPVSAQIEDVVNWLAENRSERDSLIVVSEKMVRLSANMNSLINKVYNTIQPESVIEVDYSVANGLEMNEWFKVHTHLKDSITHVVALSERDVFVKDVIRNVYLQNSMKHNVEIYGPAKTRSADVEEMCNARLHNSVTYYVDYTRRDVIDFINNYRALFHSEPDSFAFHGYDTMLYFVTICSIYGRNWEQKLSEFQMSGLQTYFRFNAKDTEREGDVNAGLRRVVYRPGFNIMVTDR